LPPDDDELGGAGLLLAGRGTERGLAC